MVKDVEAYLNQKIQKSDQFLNDWTLMQNHYAKRLWHQLTLQVDETLRKTGFPAENDLLEMYEIFISDFEHRINTLSLIEIVLLISEQVLNKDPAQAVKFLESMKEKVAGNPEALVLCGTAIGMLKLKQQKDFPGTREVIEETEKQIEELEGVTSVHSRFYQLSSLYHQLMGNHALYYREALRFLGCLNVGDMKLEEKREWAFNIGLAALLGKDVYNFGELLMHEVLASLKGTDNEWLINLLFAFNRGDIDQLESLAPKWRTQKDLAAAELALREKLILMCLMEMIFRQPATERSFHFAQIAAATRLPEDEVELLVMRALSKNLMKGRIDEVQKKVTFTWVQPRVLDLEQIGTLQARLKLWTCSVDSMRNLVEVHAQDILS